MKSLTCLVTGAGGQIGRSLSDAANASAISLFGFDKQKLDITDYDHTARTIEAGAPDVIVNTAAFTNVDLAESESEVAFAVNRDGAGNLAKICRENGIPLIHLSTDFIFDGQKHDPYQEDDPADPLSVYGQSKLEGEHAVRGILEEHIIVRTSWVFSPYGKNFVKSILSAARQEKELRVVEDQTGCPTGAVEIAKTILELAVCTAGDNVTWGTFHYGATPPVSRYEFAVEIADQCKKTIGTAAAVRPVTAAAYSAPARRPKRAVLDCSLITDSYGIIPPPWHPALEKACRSILAAP